MQDSDSFKTVNSIIQQIHQVMDNLTPAAGKCSCNIMGQGGYCAHHAAVHDYLQQATDTLTRATIQLRYPNGRGDRPQF